MSGRPKAGPVTVTKADGTVETQPAYDGPTLRRIGRDGSAPRIKSERKLPPGRPRKLSTYFDMDVSEVESVLLDDGWHVVDWESFTVFEADVPGARCFKFTEDGCEVAGPAFSIRALRSDPSERHLL